MMPLHEINAIYEQTNKDMSREEFVKKVQDLTSQKGVQRDLPQIQAILQKKQIIDRAVENG